jgi:hypothetical protein
VTPIAQNGVIVNSHIHQRTLPKSSPEARRSPTRFRSPEEGAGADPRRRFPGPRNPFTRIWIELMRERSSSSLIVKAADFRFSDVPLTRNSRSVRPDWFHPTVLLHIPDLSSRSPRHSFQST